MCSNKLVIAAAGSGKTTFLVKEALAKRSGRILITTYTQANEEEIIRKFIKLNQCVPENVTIQTWFSFLLQHGVRPYQGFKYKNDIIGLILVNGQSAQGTTESDTQRHYFSKSKKIFSDKLSKFVVKCNEKSNGLVMDRLSRIYSDIFIDEVQDLAGYDWDLLRLFLDSDINILLVGDPRQATYSTNNSSKNKKFKKSSFVDFFTDDSIDIEIDDSSLTTNHRSCPAICDLSNKLFPDFQKTDSGNSAKTDHDGVFLIKSGDVTSYLSLYKPIQLRDSSKATVVDENCKIMTFGKSKGLEFDRVLIYPTNPIIAWLKDNNNELAPTSRSKLYVALTRARSSVGIVYDQDLTIEGIDNFTFIAAEDKN